MLLVDMKVPINLLKGHPNPALLPARLIRDAAQAALSDSDVATRGLLYGPDPGYQPLRESIASWLNGFYRPSRNANADRICITGGASQNLGVMLGVFTDPEYTRNIWLVSPAYFLAFRIFEDAGFAKKMRSVPEDEEGLDLEYLRAEIGKSEEQARKHDNSSPVYKPARDTAKVYKHVIYCVASFANPSSRTMSLRRRKQLVALAREFDALVISDDVYDFLQWAADARSGTEPLHIAHLPRLVDLDDAEDGFGNTCSNGSFSKIAGPGLRCGWVEGTKKFAYGVSQAGVQRSGGAPCQLTSTYVAHLLQHGQLQRHIHQVLQPAYASRYAVLTSAVQQHLVPLGFTLPQPGRAVIGGFFLWLGLPCGLDAVDLTTECRETEDLVIAPGKSFEVLNDNHEINFPHNIRLCWAWEEEDKLKEAVTRIARSAQRLLNGQYVVVDKQAQETSVDATKSSLN